MSTNRHSWTHGLLAAYGHLFLSDKVAKQIGWQTGSMFQIELGYC